MNRKDKLEWVRQGLADYAQLERKACSEEGWIALKCSCSIRQAEKLIAAVRAESPAVKKPATVGVGAAWFAAARDLIASVEIDTSTDGGESFTVVGNVDTATLRTLGMLTAEKEASKR